MIMNEVHKYSSDVYAVALFETKLHVRLKCMRSVDGVCVCCLESSITIANCGDGGGGIV